MLWPSIWFVIGLAVLLVGAEAMVRGASRIARRLGIPALVVGLTIVAIGTSAPEIAVTVTSAYSGQSNLAVGNVVGSNIFNVLVIIGLSAMIKPLSVALNIIRIDAPIMIGCSVLLLGFGMNGELVRWEGIVLLIGMVAYTYFAYWWGRRKKEAPVVEDEYELAVPLKGQLWRQIVAIVGGLVMLTLGSRWMVDGAVQIAQHFGISDAIIGLTVVAAGTGMPELATSIVAGLRKEPDIAVGNVVGSNIMNVLAAIGLCATVSPSPVAFDRAMLTQDGPLMLGSLLLLWAMVRTGRRVSRAEGALLVGLYVGYVAFAIYRL